MNYFTKFTHYLSILFLFNFIILQNIFSQELSQLHHLSDFIDDEIINQLWNNEPFSQFEIEKEDLSKRTSTSKHFRNDDGSYSAILSSGPLHYSENGNLKTAYSSIIENNSGYYSNYKLSNVTNQIKCFYSENLSDGSLVLFENGNELKDMLDMKFYFVENGVNVSNNYEISGNNFVIDYNDLTYKNVHSNSLDVKVSQHMFGRSLDYILKSSDILNGVSSSATHMVFEESVVLPNGWSASIVNGEIILNNPYSINAKYTVPIVLDSKSGDMKSESQYELPFFEISQTNNILIIKTLVDMNWLRSPDRQFPIYIDPDLSTGTSGDDTGYLYDDHTGNNLQSSWDNDLDWWTSSLYFKIGYEKDS